MRNRILFLLVVLCNGLTLVRTEECESEIPPDPNSGCCGRDVTVDANPRIIGGKEASLRQYPWLALIEYSYKSSGRPASVLCGASLISSRYLVTAAHCVKDVGGFVASSIGLGVHDRSKPGKNCVSTPNGQDCITPVSISIEKITIHENYESNTTRKGFTVINDIALIKLKKPAPYTDHIRPICLPASDVTMEAPKNLQFQVAGWGIKKQRLIPGGSYYNYESKVKRHVSLPSWPLKKCQRIHQVIPSHICAGGQGGDACMGDSGGPLMYSRNGVYELVGAVSYGPGAPCGLRGIPGVYTKVFEYQQWILMNIGQ